MRVIRVGPSCDEIKSDKIKLDLEKIVIQEGCDVDIRLFRSQETNDYFVTAGLVVYMDEECTIAAQRQLYKSEEFKSKREAEKEYKKILKALKKGNYTLKISPFGPSGLEFK